MQGETQRSRSAGRYAARALKSYAKWWADEYQSPDPLERLKMPEEATPDPKRQHVASLDEVTKMLDACTGDEFAKRDHAVISVLSSTGMRRSEMARMTFDRIDFEAGTIVLPLTKTGGSRTVRMTPEALRSLKRHVHDSANSQHVWWNQYGRPLTADAISGIVERRAEAAGVKVTPHCFRRGMAVNWMRKGGSETLLRKQAGWSATSPMVSRYLSVHEEEQSLEEHRRLFG